jgi:hypothetical protein
MDSAANTVVNLVEAAVESLLGLGSLAERCRVLGNALSKWIVWGCGVHCFRSALKSSRL